MGSQAVYKSGGVPGRLLLRRFQPGHCSVRICARADRASTIPQEHVRSAQLPVGPIKCDQRVHVFPDQIEKHVINQITPSLLLINPRTAADKCHGTAEPGKSLIISARPGDPNEPETHSVGILSHKRLWQTGSGQRQATERRCRHPAAINHTSMTKAPARLNSTPASAAASRWLLGIAVFITPAILERVSKGQSIPEAQPYKSNRSKMNAASLSRASGPSARMVLAARGSGCHKRGVSQGIMLRSAGFQVQIAPARSPISTKKITFSRRSAFLQLVRCVPLMMQLPKRGALRPRHRVWRISRDSAPA